MSGLLIHTSLSPIRCGFVPSFVNYKKKSNNQKQELSVAAMFDNGLGRSKHL